jgi:hypothetical protein
MNRDAEHLRLLAVFHYVLAGVTALISCVPVFHVGMGLLFIILPHLDGGGQEGPPAVIGALFMVLGLAAILIGWACAFALFLAGRFLSTGKNYVFCFVVACVSCLWVPLGTILGVFTIVVLSRASVKDMFQGSPPSAISTAK